MHCRFPTEPIQRRKGSSRLPKVFAESSAFVLQAVFDLAGSRAGGGIVRTAAENGMATFSGPSSQAAGGQSTHSSLLMAVELIQKDIHRAVESASSRGRQEQWEIRSELGKGGSGVVYKGVWRGLEVAIKRVMFQVIDPISSLSLASKSSLECYIEVLPTENN